MGHKILSVLTISTKSKTKYTCSNKLQFSIIKLEKMKSSYQRFMDWYHVATSTSALSYFEKNAYSCVCVCVCVCVRVCVHVCVRVCVRASERESTIKCIPVTANQMQPLITTVANLQLFIIRSLRTVLYEAVRK